MKNVNLSNDKVGNFLREIINESIDTQEEHERDVLFEDMHIGNMLWAHNNDRKDAYYNKHINKIVEIVS
jgi:hypothetical protein